MAASPKGIPLEHSVGDAPRRWPRRLLSALALPKEHGAWAMLLVPFIVGTAVAGWGGWPSLLLLISMLALFTSSRSAGVLAKELSPAGGGWSLPRSRESWERARQSAARLAVYLGLSGTTAALLLLAHQRWALLIIGAAATLALALQLLLRQYRLDRTWPARILAIAALSTTGPAAHYAATGALSSDALAVWVLAFLYSAASVFYVRMVYRPAAKNGNGEKVRARAVRDMFAYLAGAAAIGLVLSATGSLPPLALLALVPLAVKCGWAARSRDYHPTLRQVGFAEVGHASLFALLAILTFSLR
jgi:uncharacterized membrane protein